jgi:hypothetical protein
MLSFATFSCLYVVHMIVKLVFLFHFLTLTYCTVQVTEALLDMLRLYLVAYLMVNRGSIEDYTRINWKTKTFWNKSFAIH